MSLSHNMLSSLAGFQHLRGLVSLNLNFNALTSLEGIGSCTALQQLFVANNRVRDPSPVAACTSLKTLHLFRNNIASLDLAVGTLCSLPKLKELELAGNPCAQEPDYKHRLVLQLELDALDGDTVNQLDHDLAHNYYEANGGLPELQPRVDILTLEDADAGARASESGAAAEDTQPAGPRSALDSSAAAASSSTASLPNGRPPTGQSGGAAPQLPRPGSAAARSLPAGPSGAPSLLPRPGTATRRPGSAGLGPGGRPGSAFLAASPSIQLVSDELLNNHPLIVEYLAKHVLQEGLALAEQQQGQGQGPGLGRPGSGGGGGGPGSSGRGPSFAQRLRDTAAAMAACEDVDPRALAGQGQELIATAAVVRRGLAEEMVAGASPQELCRQLVRLCEVLIREVEACRAGRPGSGGSGGRPGTAAGPRPTTPALAANRGPSGSGAGPGALTAAEAGELVALRTEVERLCRENKALRLENENMYWLAEEVKRLKAKGKDG